MNQVFAKNIKLVGDIAEVPNALPNLVLPDPALVLQLIVLAITIGIIGLLFVFQQSNTLRIVEWDTQDTGWPVERPAPRKLESGRVTIL